MPVRSLVAALLILLLGAVPAAATHDGTGCDDPGGYEVLTAEGFAFAFEAPAATAPELANPPVNHPAVTPQRTANFYFHTEFAPFRRGTAEVTLEWDDPSDYDIFVFDADGFELGRSAESNIDGGTTGEAVSITLGHCTSFHVAVRSWAGAPSQELRFAISVSGLTDEDPELLPSEDIVTPLYLGGDRPGQTASLWTQAEQIPGRAALTETRPAGGTANTFSRYPVGFDTYQNPFQAHFNAELTEPVDLDGDATIQVWLSSALSGLPEEHEGTVNVAFFADGAALGPAAEIPTSALNPWPTLHTFTFPDISFRAEFSLTVQVSSVPVTSSSGDQNPVGNSLWTVWYDSVQFPSRVMIPTAETTP